jgi:hypothetical protein
MPQTRSSRTLTLLQPLTGLSPLKAPRLVISARAYRAWEQGSRPSRVGDDVRAPGARRPVDYLDLRRSRMLFTTEEMGEPLAWRGQLAA